MNISMTESQFRRVRNVCAALIALCAALLYILTAEQTVSYWDCPEYVANAARLEPGHPPGNPVWMLTARIFTLFASAREHQALMVNIMSGICSALAVMFLFLTLTLLIRRLLYTDGSLTTRRTTLVMGASAIGASMLAVSDTFWFSAVEAEVYAFSAMLTALTVWLALLWGENRSTPHASRYIVLVAYIAGLSVGVHQLNLLVLPVVALTVVFYSFANLRRRVLAAALALSLLAIAAVLFGMMPGVIELAAGADLYFVNTLHLRLHSGVLAYVALTLSALIAACVLTQTDRPKVWGLLAAGVALWLTGLLSPAGNMWIGAVICAALTLATLLLRRHVTSATVNIVMWCAAALFTGYCSYGVILLRGAAAPPMNQGAPGQIFALRSYLNRDQYGSAPLLYGRTPYSRPLFAEQSETDPATGKSRPVYRAYARKAAPPCFEVVTDSAGNTRYQSVERPGQPVYQPELNMWFPRIHSSDPDDMESYRGWTGMDSTNMKRVEVSYALDSTGRAVGRLDPLTGERERQTALRPTYLQNLMMLGGYQVSYMYMRYLMWNFVGRQNDVYAQGEPDAGNFLTGFPPLDAVMTGPPELLPDDIGKKNPGHHNYFWLPLLLVIAGAAAQLGGGRRGRRQFALVAMLFLLTGIAIVVYLNQTPGEPRERDYSFVGSFYACCIWAGVGAAWVGMEARRRWYATRRRTLQRLSALTLVGLVVVTPIIMIVENFPDHDRSGRTLTREFARATLESLPPDAIFFINGDNYTFPLWYMQEVEGSRPDVRTINLAYLSTLWYPPQLAQGAPGASAVRFTLPADSLTPMMLNRFAVVDIGFGTRDARQAMASLFAQRPAGEGRPRIDADSIRLAVPGRDSVTMSLRDMAAGHGYLRVDKVLMLDILANNLPDRPVLFHTALSPDQMLSLAPYTTQLGLASNVAYESDSLEHNLGVITRHFANAGIVDASYVDVPGRQQVAMLRHYLATVALQLMARGQEGDVEQALKIARLSQTMLPPERVPYTSQTRRGVPYSDAVMLAEIYLKGWQATGREDLRLKACRLAFAELERCAAYDRYLSSLPERYRTYTKGATRMSRQMLYAPVDLLLRAGEDSVNLMRDPRARHIDMSAARARWRALTQTK